ncbi:MAG: cysteine desulfurase [Spirochaetales bacterium]|nr:cysteine desulfurase [Spirochaetales bacterium]
MIKYSYFDNAATTRVSKQALEDYTETINNFPYNPSSVYKGGMESYKAIQEAREKLGGMLSTSPANLFFTSSGSESNNLYISSLLNKRSKGKILISAIEHPSALFPAQRLREFGYEVITLNLDSNGQICLKGFENALDRSVKAVIVMHVNNEVGTIQPVKEIGQIIRDFEKNNLCSIHFHVDAVQSFCKIDFQPEKWNIDSASFSSHKLYAPRGVGLFYCKKSIQPIYLGGGQERGYRPGTENTAGIVAFANEAERQNRLLEQNFLHTMELKNLLISSLSGEGIFTFFNKKIHETTQSPYIASLNVKPIPAEVLTRVMDSAGFAISSGSACSANSPQKIKYVLEACKLSKEEAFSTVRISFCPDNTQDEVVALAEALKNEVKILKQIR